MTWWYWDGSGRCWRPSTVASDAPLGVNEHPQLIPLNRSHRWALLARLPGVRVNGLPCLPIAVLGR